MARASASLRTTWRCTWLLAGTSITTSAHMRAEHDRRLPGASGARFEKRISGSLSGERLALEEDTPSFANSPSATSTWQRPQSARPPHTESMSTPRLRAACRSGVPSGKWPRFPEGMNTTRGARATMRAAGPSGRAAAMPALAASAGRLACAGGPGGRAGTGRRQRVAKTPDPARAIRIVAQHHVGTHDRLDDFDVHGVGDRGGEPRRHRHCEKRAVDSVAVRQTEAHVRGAARGIDLELFAQTPHQTHDLHARLIDGADRHHQRIDH